MSKKFYYLAPTWTMPPHDARGLALGNIIISPKDPCPPLATASPNTLTDTPMRDRKPKVKWSYEKGRSGMFGVYAKFLEMVVGAGVDASFSKAKRKKIDFSFDTMITEELTPSDEDVKLCMTQDRVVNYLKSSLIRRPVYMIVGIKYVSGAVAEFSRESRYHSELGVGVDATALAGVPVSAGVEIAPGGNKNETTSWTSLDDFVFAFRVVRIEAKSKDTFTSKPYQTGTMLDGSHGPRNYVAKEIYETREDVADTGILVIEKDEEVLVGAVAESFSRVKFVARSHEGHLRCMYAS